MRNNSMPHGTRIHSPTAAMMFSGAYTRAPSRQDRGPSTQGLSPQPAMLAIWAIASYPSTTREDSKVDTHPRSSGDLSQSFNLFQATDGALRS